MLVQELGAGQHSYFRHPGYYVKSQTGALGPGLDIKGDGGYVVAPPSSHVSGQRYEWTVSCAPGEAQLADMPRHIAEEPPQVGRLTFDQHYGPIPEGHRNNTLASLAGSMRRAGDSKSAILSALLELNRSRCVPPLPDDEVTAIANSIARYPAGEPDEHDQTAHSGKPILNPHAPLRIARRFLNERYTIGGHYVLQYYAGTFLAWRDNAYHPKETKEIQAELYQFLDGSVKRRRPCDTESRFVPFSPGKRVVEEVIDALQAEVFLSAEVSPPTWLHRDPSCPAALELIPCRSRLLHLPTLRTYCATPALFTTSALPVEYAPDADVPALWLRFLSQLWPGDDESIATLQQWFGYCLAPDTRQQKMLLVVGPRRSGKGSIARVLTALLGQANVVAPTTSSLTTQFGLQPLIGKSLAIVSDARFRGQREQTALVERLLCISGEDAISISRKYLDALTLKLPTRFMFLTNELPRLADVSAALAGRFIILVLEKSFFGEEDLGLTDKLLRGLPGVLNWAVKGWQDLQQRGRFEQHQSSLDVVREVEDLSSPVKVFVRDRCEIGPAYSVGTRSLYEAWCDWCQDYGREHAGTAASFGGDLHAAYPQVHKSRPRDDTGGRVRRYVGVGLKTSFGPGRSLDLTNGSLASGPKGSGHASGGEERQGGPRTSVDRPLVVDEEVSI